MPVFYLLSCAIALPIVHMGSTKPFLILIQEFSGGSAGTATCTTHLLSPDPEAEEKFSHFFTRNISLSMPWPSLFSPLTSNVTSILIG